MKKKNLRKFLVFSPHPDDLDFGCSGTVARLTSEGNEVVYCIVTNGEKGVDGIKQLNKSVIVTREEEQKAAARIVGVEKVIFLRQKDGDLEYTRDLCKEITKVIREVKPDVVISMDPGNRRFDNFYVFHRDHRITAEVVFDAIYPAGGSEVFFPEFIGEKILPHQVKEVWFFGTDKPSLYINVSKTIDRKFEALGQHKSQIKDIKEIEKFMRAHLRDIGRKKKMAYAESFRVLKF